MRAMFLGFTGILGLSAAAIGVFSLNQPLTISPARATTAAVSGVPALARDNLVVAELFTSQGCSSCPPADRLAASLVDQPGLLIISRPVTYWDRLGWKDTLARPENTALQRAYAGKGFAEAGVYTPQMVINGRDAAIGSRGNSVRSRISAGHQNRISGQIKIHVANNTAPGRPMKTVTLAGSPPHAATVTLVALSRHESVKVGRGENGGRQLDFTNVLKAEKDIGRWSGGDQQIPINASDLDVSGADRYAIIVRIGSAGEIIAASYL